MSKFVKFEKGVNVSPHIRTPFYMIGLKISPTAKIVYGFMLSRAHYSAENDYRDENGVFIRTSVDEMAYYLEKGRSAINDAVNALLKAGYIKKKRMGLNSANKYYIMVPIDYKLIPYVPKWKRQQIQHSSTWETEHPDAWELEQPDIWETEHPDAWETEHPDAWETEHPDAWKGEHPDAWKGEHPDAWKGEHPDAWKGEHPDAWKGEHPDAWKGEHPDGWKGEHPDGWKTKHPDTRETECPDEQKADN